MYRFSVCIALLSACCTGFQAQDYDDYIGAGHSDGITVTSSSESNGSDDVNTINGFGLDQQFADASRFLIQSSLGADWETIEEVAAMGYENWIDAQYGLQMTSLHDTTDMIWNHFLDEYYDTWGTDEVFENPGILPYSTYLRMGWWHNVMNGNDLLRHRVAVALSEILVISEKSNLVTAGLGMADYYDVLYEHAFGNYQDLLMDVTYHPCMGFYLSHLNNEKTDDFNNIHPDENYAREVMQLFTIGLYELDNDGTVQLDDDDVPIPTYDNSVIKQYAKVFTGLGPAEYYSPWEDLSGVPVVWNDWLNTVPFINTTLPMEMFPDWHEPGQKTLLNDYVIPDGLSGDQDIALGIESLFNHPNCGPFICKQLIQKLVKSNPTPEYVDRVASKFNNNGDDVRGDMKAVIKAILLDDEARDCEWIEMTSSGKMKEPLVRYTQLMRAFNASNESGRMWNVGYFFDALMGQHILGSPSVFSFYLPYYTPPGPVEEEGLVAPEFQILTATTSLNWINMLQGGLLVDYYMDIGTEASEFVIGTPEFNSALLAPEDLVSLDLSDELSLVNDSEDLVDRLDILLCGGTMTEESKETISDVVDLLFLDNTIALKTAIWLATISPDYIIQK
jgi:uncharacterized protein (DUF1800 family)